MAAAGGSWGRLGAAGGGWGRLASRGAGGQRRRRRWGDFGLNTGIFFSETIFFGASQVALCGCRGGVKTTKISHQEKDGYLFSPTSTSVLQACPLHSGSAVEAQRMWGLKPLYCTPGCPDVRVHRLPRPVKGAFMGGLG